MQNFREIENANENFTSSFEQLIVAATPLMVFTKFSHFAFSQKFRFIYFREKMQNFAKKFAKYKRKYSHVFGKDVLLEVLAILTIANK